MNLNPHNIRDGEPLSIKGGPLDGQSYRAAVLLPELDGGLPCTGFVLDGHCYQLNQAERCWEHVGTTTPTPPPPCPECGDQTVETNGECVCPKCDMRIVQIVDTRG